MLEITQDDIAYFHIRKTLSFFYGIVDKLSGSIFPRTDSEDGTG